MYGSKRQSVIKSVNYTYAKKYRACRIVECVSSHMSGESDLVSKLYSIEEAYR
jgi:hypothetical protein